MGWYMKIVHFKLKEYMDRNKITQAKLAQDTNLAPNTVKAYYHDDVIRAELRVIAVLCNYLKCDICDIMALEDMQQTEIE
ncbi:helix-turn-helix transcriptional regulator [Anaerolineae bacterium CFX9]|nr:hypothetical protein [Anaerolineae bacterium]MDL1899165.1 helix-turn-helix transcriptional regulator [Anaerolineae bacterium CFX9]GIK76140.1 MAG: hypothetical protein BroJett021_51280 [Chloroflexota bacterium]